MFKYFKQAAECVASGLWRCNAGMAIRLASLQMRICLGKFDAKEHTVRSVSADPRFARWLPSHMRHNMSSAVLAARILAAFTRVDTDYVSADKLRKRSFFNYFSFLYIYFYFFDPLRARFFHSVAIS